MLRNAEILSPGFVDLSLFVTRYCRACHPPLAASADSHRLSPTLAATRRLSLSRSCRYLYRKIRLISTLRIFTITTFEEISICNVAMAFHELRL